MADGIGTPDETARFTLTLAAGQQRIIADVIDAELRRGGVEGISPSRGGLAGALFATPESGDLSGIVVGARTGSPDGRGGQYGVFYTAVPDGAAFTETAWIYGLQQNQENRTNLALVNTGEVDDSRSTFAIHIYDQNGTHQLKNVVFEHVEARRWLQINSILANRRAAGITQAYVRIEQFIGNNPFLAYAVVNDGGAPGRTQRRRRLPARPEIAPPEALGPLILRLQQDPRPFLLRQSPRIPCPPSPPRNPHPPPRNPPGSLDLR